MIKIVFSRIFIDILVVSLILLDIIKLVGISIIYVTFIRISKFKKKL
jgi:hypothetical protein